VKTGEPQILSRILGVEFAFKQVAEGGVKNWEVEWGMVNYVNTCVSRYQEEVGPIKECRSPSHAFKSEDFSCPKMQSPGKNGHVAARLLMSALYACRMARPDVSYSVCATASFLTKWTVMSDIRLAAIYGYLKSTSSFTQKAKIRSGSLSTLAISCFADSDLGGSDDNGRSTSGGILFINDGFGGDMAVGFHSKRQHSTSTSTAEAELVSLGEAVKSLLYPIHQLMEDILGRAVRAVTFEDNESCGKIVTAGVSVALRHVRKHHRLSIGFLNEVYFTDPNCQLAKVDTSRQRADGLTKSLSPKDMQLARHQLSVCGPGQRPYACDFSHKDHEFLDFSTSTAAA
jgi:hypothetical protein